MLERDPDPIVYPSPDKPLYFLEGPPGVGKTTLAVRRMRQLLQSGVSAESILILVPQRPLAKAYLDALWELDMPGTQVNVATVGGLARRWVDLYWPLISERAGFAHPLDLPVFLTLETTQYYMDRIVGPYVDQGQFEGLAIRRNRLGSQIVDNLNKAAVVGFAHTEISERLKSAWVGERSQTRLYDLAQACASAFRRYCLANNLLDFSLQIKVFFEHVLSEPICRESLFGCYRHLIVDNIEEDTPRAHDLLRQWLGQCDTALLVMDQQGGYRAFMGADAEGAAELRWLCQEQRTITDSCIMSPAMAALSNHLLGALGPQAGIELLPPSQQSQAVREADPRAAMSVGYVNFQPQLITWVADEVQRLVQEDGVPPGEIAILAPFLGDALRFALSTALETRGLAVRSHRPSRALFDESAAHCLLTLARFAYPSWYDCPEASDVAQALMVAIDDLDLVRARLLTEIVYRQVEGHPELGSFDLIRPDTQQRIGFISGERFELLRHWLIAQAGRGLELDDLIARFFRDVLSRPGFGFYQNLDAGRVTETLIESIQKFRRVVGGLEPAFNAMRPIPGTDSFPEIPVLLNRLGHEYIAMISQGIFAATYVSSWQTETEGAVLMMPAYTFLMTNRPVEVQFWLDAGSAGWWERLNQPLTHPYVLSRRWIQGQVWSDDDEYRVRQRALGRLILGLTRRCRRHIYMGIAEFGEQGYEQRGPLLQAVQHMLRRVGN